MTCPTRWRSSPRPSRRSTRRDDRVHDRCSAARSSGSCSSCAQAYGKPALPRLLYSAKDCRETDMTPASRSRGLRSTDPADYQRVPRPVAAMAKDFPDGYHNRPHKHERAQLIFAAHGAMLVATSAGSWAVPPQRAVWMPAGLVHETRMLGAVAMRTLYTRKDAAVRLPASVRVVAVSPLLRELILRACALPITYDETGPAGRLMALIIDEIAALPTVALDLPLPRDTRLGRICRALAAEPGATRTLEDWGR